MKSSWAQEFFCVIKVFDASPPPNRECSMLCQLETRTFEKHCSLLCLPLEGNSIYLWGNCMSLGLFKVLNLLIAWSFSLVIVALCRPLPDHVPLSYLLPFCILLWFRFPNFFPILLFPPPTFDFTGLFESEATHSQTCFFFSPVLLHSSLLYISPVTYYKQIILSTKNPSMFFFLFLFFHFMSPGAISTFLVSHFWQ